MDKVVLADINRIRLTEPRRGRVESLHSLYKFFVENREGELIPPIAREESGDFYVMDGRNQSLLYQIFGFDQVPMFVADKFNDRMLTRDFPDASPQHLDERNNNIMTRFNSCIGNHNDVAKELGLNPGFSISDLLKLDGYRDIATPERLKQYLSACGYDV